MRSGRGASKELVGKKSSGLGKLMSVLHQNAESLVTTRAQHNGPDQVLPATELTTCHRNQAVKIRREETGLGAEEPLSVPSLLHQVAESYPDIVAMKAQDRESGQWKVWTYSKLQQEVDTVARALLETGLHRHHSVAIIGRNSPYWVISNLAAISAGGIAAGLSDGLNPEEIARICIDCKADVIVVEQESLLKKILLIQHKLPELKCIVQCYGEPPMSDQRRLARSHKKHILSWADLLELGRAIPADRLEERLTKVSINQCCSLVYATSNKGVMLSHDNLTWSAKMTLGVIRAPGFNITPPPGEEVMMSFLPLSHISTQLIDIYYMISVAGTTVFPATDILHSQEEFFTALEEVQPTVLYGPPMIFERLYHKLVNMRRSVSGVQKFFIDWSSHQIREKHGDSVSSDPEHRAGIQQTIAKNTVCKKYKESMGLGPKTLFLCRGGALPDGVLKFLSGFDIVVHSAYGQSECCSLLSSNIPKRFCKFSSVGKPGPGVRVKLGEGGEVLGQGRNIFMGYLNRENETKERLTKEDEWLRLGDQAHFDEEGFLVLSCYPGDLLTLSSGEEVEPSRLEDRVRMELGCVAHCLLVGQGREGLGILLSLDTELEAGGLPTNRLTPTCQAWFRAARFDVKTVAEVLEGVELGIKHVIQAGIDRTNLGAERASQFITVWEILPHCFSLNTGELGQTGKVNRTMLTEKYSRTINRLFTGEDSFPEEVRKRSSELHQPFSQQLSQIVEEEERSQRDSQDKETVHKDIQEEDEEAENVIDEVRKNVEAVKVDDKEESTEDSSESEEEVNKRMVQTTATIETPYKHDQNTTFEDTMDVQETRKKSRT